MNLRAFFLMPLLAVFLVSCGGGGDTSVPQSSGGSQVSSIDVYPVMANGAALVTPGYTQQFEFKAHYSTGEIVQQSAELAIWTSSNPSVATINKSGLATAGTTDGSTTITASFSGVTSYSVLYVKTPGSLSIQPNNGHSASVASNGSPLALDAILHFSDGTTKSAGNHAIWTSSNTSVGAIYKNFGLQPIAEGVTTVTVSDSGATGSIDITVLPPAVPTSITIDGLLSSSGTFAKRTHMLLSATVGLSSGGSIAASAPVWSSSDSSVFTITPTGQFAGVGPGTATITVSANGLTTSKTITLIDALPSPAIVVSCAATMPTTISAATWNAYYALDPTNLTEWVAVDATSCNAFPFVVLVVSPSQFAQYSILLAPRYSTNSFDPAITSSSTMTPQLSPGTTVTIGYKPTYSSFYYTSIYSIQVQ